MSWALYFCGAESVAQPLSSRHALVNHLKQGPHPLVPGALDVDDRRSPSRGDNHCAVEPASRAFWCVEDAESRMDPRLGHLPGDEGTHESWGED
ncbi:hypothetical protein FDECE_16283 [Fusarium decemcellulare]|nr:hypothetical protein FDECE_16283 [Fusarium decemcellulare]